MERITAMVAATMHCHALTFGWLTGTAIESVVCVAGYILSDQTTFSKQAICRREPARKVGRGSLCPSTWKLTNSILTSAIRKSKQLERHVGALPG